MASGSRARAVMTAVSVFAATVVLVWFGNGLVPWWPLMWFVPLPLFWYSLRARWWSAAVVAGSAWLVGSTNMLAYFHTLGAPFWVWLADFGGMSLIVATGVLLFRFLVARRAVWPAIAALPSLWVSVDWLRYWATPHGTAADLAYTQLDFLPFLQLASVTGPWGLTFLLLLVPGAAAVAIHLREREPRRARQVLAVIGGLLFAVLLFGAIRLAQPGQQQIVKVGLIAADAWGGDDIASSGSEAERLLRTYSVHAQTLASQGAQVVLMPEKLAVVRDIDAPASYAVLQSLADAAGVTIVAGELHVSPAGNDIRKYNRAQVYTPHSSVASYDKEHLLPPFESDMIPGTTKLTVARNGATWGVAICKDMDFTSTSIAYGRLGAGLMLVPAWDFNMDRVWHGHMAVMRGVEGGFSVVRAAKNGDLTVSDDRGRVTSQIRSDSAPFATLLATVPAVHVPTLFQRWGDWFAWVAVGALVLVNVRSCMLLRQRHFPGASLPLGTSTPFARASAASSSASAKPLPSGHSQ